METIIMKVSALCKSLHALRYVGKYLLLILIICFYVSNGFCYDMPYYSGPWAVIHRDNRNSDYAPFKVADTYTPLYQVTRTQLPFNKPVIGPDKTIYYTYKGPGYAGFASYIVGIDGPTSTTKFVLGPPLIDRNVSAGNVMVGHDGDFFISDDRALMRFTSQGSLVWRTLVTGVSPSGVQYLPDGNLLMMAWNGILYVIDPEDGIVLYEKNMTPLRTYPLQAPGDCFRDGDSDDCVFANIAAVDPFRSVFYQTFIAREGQPSAVNAYSYRTSPFKVQLMWTNRSLDGGSASSVAVSSDYTRLYVTDRADHLVAIDALTGELLWKKDVGYTPNSSVCVNPNGYVVPGVNYRDTNFHLKIYKDMGYIAELVYENTDYDMLTGISAAADDRFVLIGRNKETQEVVLMVIHPEEGIVGISPWGDGDRLPNLLTGVSVSTGGVLVVVGKGDVGIKVFSPVWTE